jgi:uncharacterized protein
VLVAGLLLVAVGVGAVAYALAAAAGLLGPGRGARTAAEAPQPTAEAPQPTAEAPRTSGPAPTTGDRPATATYRLEPERGPAVTVRLEVAADPVARARGLMGRREVPAGTGMVFLYPAEVTGPFWMKNTLVPLSIAFVAADGRVVSVAEMTPCRADPCPTYPPAGPYRYAVELAAGAFAAAGVGPGARVVPDDPAALPEPV